MKEEPEKHTTDQRSYAGTNPTEGSSHPDVKEHRVLPPEAMPPMGVSPHEFVHLDLSRLPVGIRLFVTDPWADTQITRADHTLHAISAVKVYAPQQSTVPAEDDLDAASSVTLKWEMKFPDATDTRDVLRAVEEARSLLRTKAEVVGGKVEPAGDSAGHELGVPIFPVDLTPKSPTETITLDQFMARDLKSLPNLAGLEIVGSEPAFGCGRIGDDIIAAILKLERLSTEKSELRGKVIAVINREREIAHLVMDNPSPGRDERDAPNTVLLVKLNLTYPLDVTPVEVHRTIAALWKEAQAYTKALLS